MTTAWTPDRVVQRVLSKIDVDGDCWISQYADQGRGYAYVGFSENGKMHYRLVHRVAWVHFNGPIPDGLVVDHICKRRRCINPVHLRLLTLAENTRDQVNANAAKSTCRKGHPYDMADTGRRCRTCTNERARANYRKRKELA